ncbi:50S ribosomal protein L29 [bacterium]|nr:50S ribosomal protein L29 [bacterium]
MLKIREIVNMTLTEIQHKLRDSEEELANLKFQLATHQLDDTSKVKWIRRDIARLKTVLYEIETGRRSPVGAAEGAV